MGCLACRAEHDSKGQLGVLVSPMIAAVWVWLDKAAHTINRRAATNT